MTTPIVFPGLGIQVTIDPVAFRLFGKEIYWYGILIAAGFLLGLYAMMRLSQSMGASENDIVDMMLLAMPIGLVGARAYYVFFYQSLFRDADGVFQWGRAVAIWDGGLAVYGGIIAGVLTAVVFSRVRRIPFWPMADTAAFGLPIGQAIGRWGNFVNQEAHGGPCTAPWRMGLTVAGQYMEVHPTFLYESLWNLAGLALLYFVVRPRRRFAGQMFFSYVLWYGLGRVWIEGLRSDSLYLFSTGIRVSQLLAALSAVIALTVILYRLKKAPKGAGKE